MRFSSLQSVNIDGILSLFAKHSLWSCENRYCSA